MMRLFGQMMKLPYAALLYSVEMFVKTLYGVQRVTEQNAEVMFNGGASAPSNPVVSGAATHGQQLKEDSLMPDQDLSTDDLKYVSYVISFTKRDLEVTLEEEKSDVVGYATNGASYGGLKIAKFMQRVARHQVQRPRLWQENDYPSDAQDNLHWEIPEEDEKYVTFVYQVDHRSPKQAPNYEREQVKVLREISRKIG